MKTYFLKMNYTEECCKCFTIFYVLSASTAFKYDSQDCFGCRSSNSKDPCDWFLLLRCRRCLAMVILARTRKTDMLVMMTEPTVTVLSALPRTSTPRLLSSDCKPFAKVESSLKRSSPRHSPVEKIQKQTLM